MTNVRKPILDNVRKPIIYSVEELVWQELETYMDYDVWPHIMGDMENVIIDPIQRSVHLECLRTLM